MPQEPYHSADRVFWIFDNGSSHRGERACNRLKKQWPTIELVHLPIHASWLNQIEIYFSVESYGSVEMEVIAHETPERNGLRLCADTTYFEFLDDDNRPVPPGLQGRVVVTDLFGKMMPFNPVRPGRFCNLRKSVIFKLKRHIKNHEDNRAEL